MKYTKENLASKLADLINFEDGVTYLVDEEIIFNKCTVYVEGIAYSVDELSGGVVFDFVELSKCDIVHDDCDVNTEFNSEELNELEGDIKLWS